MAVLCAVAAVAVAKPYAFTEVAPLTSYYGAVPYSVFGAHYSPLAYSALHTPVVSPVVHTPVVHTPVVHTPVVAAAPAVGVKTQYHSQDFIGQATYGHVEPHQSHAAVQDAAGNKVGSFSYVKPDGSVARTDYVADALGYRVASNDLPVAPMVKPLPVAETPEVVAARMAHFAEFEKVKSRARRQVILPASTSPLVHHVAPVVHTPVVHSAYVHSPVVHTPLAYSALYTSHHIPVVTPSGHLADTPEVTAAKIAHFAEHAKAASRMRRQVLAYAHHTPLVSTHYNPLLTHTVPLAYSHGVHSVHHTVPLTHHNVHYTF